MPRTILLYQSRKQKLQPGVPYVHSFVSRGCMEYKGSASEKLVSSINRIPDLPPPSRFPHLASTMLLPTTEEKAIIKAIIQDSERHLSQLKDIERAIRGQSDAYLQYQSQYRSMLSTLRSMPPEVLSDIFLRCLP